MKTENKILIGFLVIFVFAILFVVVGYIFQNYMLNAATQVKDVEMPLNVMVEQVIGYDAMLTGYAHAALLHAQKNELNGVIAYKIKYDEIGVKLDDLLKHDARTLLEQSERPQEIKDEVYADLKQLDEVNLALVDLETRAFAAMEKGDGVTAYSLIVSQNYQDYKQELSTLYQDWASIEKNMVLVMQKDLINKNQQLIYLNMFFSIVLFTTMIVILFLMQSFIKKKCARKEENKKTLREF